MSLELDVVLLDKTHCYETIEVTNLLCDQRLLQILAGDFLLSVQPHNLQ